MATQLELIVSFFENKVTFLNPSFNHRIMNKSRRKFLNQFARSALAYSIAPALLNKDVLQMQEDMYREKKFSPNDHLQIALIGAGGMGTADANTAISVPGVKLIAACDLYDGRIDAAKKSYGADIFTTKDFHEIIDRKDIDAVI